MEAVRDALSDSYIHDELLQLTSNVDFDPALNNDFYDAWLAGPMSRTGVLIFFRNYSHFSWEFPYVLESLIKRTPNGEIRGELNKTLHSEMGNGRAEKAHRLLLHQFIAALSAEMEPKGAVTRDWLNANVALLDTSRQIVDSEYRLYGQESHAKAVGAQLALEWQAFTMLMKLYEGARNYMSFFPNERAFHEAAEYFYVHLGEAEKDHKTESINAARIQISDHSELEELRQGYFEHLSLFHAFWQGIAAAVVSADASAG